MDTQNHPLQKKQWIKLGLFCIACILAINGIIFNQIIFALLASLAMCCSFWNLNEGSSTQDDAIVLGKNEVTPTQLFFTIALFVAAILSEVGAVYFSGSQETAILSLILWLIAIALIMSAGIVFDWVNPFTGLKRIRGLSPESKKYLFIEVGLVTAITAIALLLRVTNLEVYPHVMHGDEGEMGMEALRVLGIGDPIPPFWVGWGLFPNLYYYMLAGSIHIFGRNEIGLRMVSALFGTFCVPLVYLIGRRFWGKLAGYTGAWLIAVSHFNINYSRFGLNNIESAFFMILFILLYLVPHFSNLPDQNREPGKFRASDLLNGKFNITPYIAAGLTCGLAQYMYLGSRLILLVALPLYILLFAKKRINIIQVVAVGVSAILALAPLGRVYFQDPNALIARMGSVSVLNPENVKANYGENATLSNSLFPMIQNQFGMSLKFFLRSGDASTFYYPDIPGFDFVTAMLFWLGLGVVFTRPRRLPELTLIVWFVFGIIFGGILTDSFPYGAYGTRLLTVTSVIFIMGGIFIQRTWDVLSEFFNGISSDHATLVRVFTPILLFVFMATMVINTYYYFRVYPMYGLNIVPMDITKEIISDAPMNHVYLLGNGEIYVGHGTIRFLAGEDRAADLKTINDLPPLVKDGKGITILATLKHVRELDSLKSLYPQGYLSGKYFFGRLILMKYQIPPLSLQ